MLRAHKKLCLIASIVLLPSVAYANHECTDVEISSAVTVTYSPSGTPLPTSVRFEFDVTWEMCICGSSSQGTKPALPAVGIELLDCDQGIIASATKEPDTPATCPTNTRVLERVVFDLALPQGCPRQFPKYYRIIKACGCAGDGQPDNSAWCSNQPGNCCDTSSCDDLIDMPALPIDCNASQSDLQCLACDLRGEISSESLKFYKTDHTLYTLSEKDESGAVWAEAINGEFIAPENGILFVNVSGGSATADVYGSATPDGDGWMVLQGGAAVRQGIKLTGEKCYVLTTNQKFKYNLRGGRSDTARNLSIRFDWYVWDEEECCAQQDQSIIDVQVLTLPCLLVDTEPIRPKRKYWTKSDGSQDIELRIPCCETGNDNVRSLYANGDLTGWFVKWPSQPNKVIPDGLAKGWRINGDLLIEPGTNGLEYEFEE